MTKTTEVSSRLDAFGRRHRRLTAVAVGALTVFVAVVLLTATDAPVVLYQAF